MKNKMINSLKVKPKKITYKYYSEVEELVWAERWRSIERKKNYKELKISCSISWAEENIHENYFKKWLLFRLIKMKMVWERSGIFYQLKFRYIINKFVW